MKSLVFLFSLIFFYSCNESKKEIEKVDILGNQKYVNTLTERCVKYGDSNAFGELIDFYGRFPSERYELLPLSIIMADKYGNDNARVTIFFQIIMINNNGKRDRKLFFRLKQKHKDFIVSYLIEGVKNNNPGCKGILMEIINGGYQLKNDDKYIKNLLKE